MFSRFGSDQFLNGFIQFPCVIDILTFQRTFSSFFSFFCLDILCKTTTFSYFRFGAILKPVEKFIAMNKNMNKQKIALHFLCSVSARKTINRKLVSRGAKLILFIKKLFFDLMPKDFSVRTMCMWRPNAIRHCFVTNLADVLQSG